MRTLNKSNLKKTMDEVRVEEAIRKVAEAAKTSKMDSSKKVDFMVLAKMMSDSDIGAVRIKTDSLNLQERAGITDTSDNPQVGIIRRSRDNQTGNYEETKEHMTLEELVDYSMPRVDKSRFDDAKIEYYYDEVRKEIIDQISKTRLTDNDRLHLESIALLVTTSTFRRLFLDHQIGNSLSTIGITKVENPETGKEEHRLAVFTKHRDEETKEISESMQEMSLEDLLSYSLTRIPRETMRKGRELALKERARIKIEEDIDKSGLPEEERTKLKALEYLVLNSSLNRIDIKQTHPSMQEKLTIRYEKNPRLAIAYRFRDPETGSGDERYKDMSLEELSKYLEDKIPDDSRNQSR